MMIDLAPEIADRGPWTSDTMPTLTNDPIVEEMRTYGQEFASRHGNDIQRICDVLRQSEIASRRKVVHGGPKRLHREVANRQSVAGTGTTEEFQPLPNGVES